jgi:hypothetical protein
MPDVSGIPDVAVVAPQSGDANRGRQLPRQGSLPTRQIRGPPEMVFLYGFVRVRQHQKLALYAQHLGHARERMTRPRPTQRSQFALEKGTEEAVVDLARAF